MSLRRQIIYLFTFIRIAMFVAGKSKQAVNIMPASSRLLQTPYLLAGQKPR